MANANVNVKAVQYVKEILEESHHHMLENIPDGQKAWLCIRERIDAHVLRIQDEEPNQDSWVDTDAMMKKCGFRQNQITSELFKTIKRLQENNQWYGITPRNLIGKLVTSVAKGWHIPDPELELLGDNAIVGGPAIVEHVP
jgi:hypothetical protein